MERETELTQTWNPDVADRAGGFLNGIPLLVGGELKTFSLPTPLDDDGTDISLKDWQLGPRETTAPYSIKPFKGSVRTRFTPMEPRLDEDLSPRGQSSPDHFETTPTTPRTPRTSSSGTRSSSVSPSKTFLQEGDQTLLASLQRDDVSTPTTGSESNSSLAASEEPHATTPRGIAFDVTLDDPNLAAAATDTNNKSNRSLRVSFVETRPPVVRHKSPLKSRSLHPSKEAKAALQPKWESSTKIRHPISSSASDTKVQVQAPAHGVKRRATPRAGASPLPVPAPEIESEFHDASGYFSDGRGLSSRRSLDSQSRDQSRGGHRDYSSTYVGNQVVRDLTMSPVRDSKASSQATLPRSFGRRELGARHDDDDDDDDEAVKAGMRCGGGLPDTKLSGDFVRLLSKLCRVSSVPASKQSATKSGSRGRKFERSNIVTSLSWDPTAQKDSMRESYPVIGRHDSLKLLSEKCSNAPAPTYDVHKPRKIRDHEPHIHFYKSISKTLDQKLRR